MMNSPRAHTIHMNAKEVDSIDVSGDFVRLGLVLLACVSMHSTVCEFVLHADQCAHYYIWTENGYIKCLFAPYFLTMPSV